MTNDQDPSNLEWDEADINLYLAPHDLLQSLSAFLFGSRLSEGTELITGLAMGSERSTGETLLAETWPDRAPNEDEATQHVHPGPREPLNASFARWGVVASICSRMLYRRVRIGQSHARPLSRQKTSEPPKNFEAHQR